MTTATATHASLSAAMTGRVVEPGDPDWDAARQTFNLLDDQRPEAIALPASVRDVIAAVRHARELGLRVAAQATGHNAGPLGSLEGTLLVSVAGLDSVAIDAAARRVRVGAGVKWERVTPALSELGLAALHGSSPDVGIAGYSLGGGIGWLSRKLGMHTNAVTAFDLVTADGELVRASAAREPDLFWALRGGGGNFGVVTAIEFRAFAIPELYAGQLFFPFERAGEVLHAWGELLPSLPDELMTWAAMLRFPDLPFVPERFRGNAYTVVYGVHMGDEAQGRALLAPVRELGPELDTFATVPPAEIGELAMDPPDPLPYRTAHHLLGELPAEAIDALLAVAGPGSGSALDMVQLRHMGGALGRAEPGAGARATLPGEISLLGLGVVPDAEHGERVEGWLGALHAALAPYRAGDYPNFVEEPADASAFFDADTWARLRAVKAAYDPDDVFRANHAIPPAA